MVGYQTDIEILISISTLPHFADYNQFFKFIKGFFNYCVQCLEMRISNWLGGTCVTEEIYKIHLSLSLIRRLYSPRFVAFYVFVLLQVIYAPYNTYTCHSAFRSIN